MLQTTQPMMDVILKDGNASSSQTQPTIEALLKGENTLDGQ